MREHARTSSCHDGVRTDVVITIKKIAVGSYEIR